MNLVAVTACPTGIAHSQMAAENLEQTAEAAGHEIRVEIQGAMGAEDELTAAEIEAADAVIIAADTSVQRDRFEGKPLVKGTVKDAVNDAEGLVEEAVAAAGGDAEAVEYDGDGSEAATGDEASTGAGESAGAGESPAAGKSAGAGESSDGDREPQRRGGDPSKGLFARLKRLFS